MEPLPASPVTDVSKKIASSANSANLNFTPTTKLLMKELDLVPPPTPKTPELISGRGYSKEELEDVASLENEEEIKGPPQFTTLELFMLHENTLKFLPISALGTMQCLSKEFNKTMSESEKVWHIACSTLATQKSLYLPYAQLERQQGRWKSIFFEQLFPARNKWGVDEGDAAVSSDFKIQVASRFRPGPRKNSSILLPLHQRLRLLRKQQKAGSALTLGSQLPDHFVDPLMGGVMNSPVKLPGSGKVCERKVILGHLKRDSHDPFDSSPLSAADLAPCTELKEEIKEFNRKKKTALYAEKEGEDGKGEGGGGNFRVASDDVKALTEAERDITPEILRALLEADRLGTALKEAEEQAEREERGKARKEFNKWGDEEGEEEEQQEDREEAPGAGTAADPSTEPLPSSSGADLSKALANSVKESDIKQIITAPQKRDARILGIEKSRVLIHIDGRGIRQFLMSGGCFTGSVGQKDVYEKCGRSPVVSALNGTNACLLAYGQTGSGKTHTMFGPDNVLVDCWEAAKEASSRKNSRVEEVVYSVLNTRGGEVGLAVRACAEICSCLGLHENSAGLATEGNVAGTLSCQYVQIYNEQITCLLGSTNEVQMRGEVMQGARTVMVTSLSTMLELLVLAETNKKRAATAMNDRSSRSHSILVFNISQKNKQLDSLVKSVLHVVDLAGSERLKKSKVEGIHKSEAININSSLMVLGKVVSALVERKRHVPYFESKLTSILRNSLGGNSRTTAIVAARMDDAHANETLQSLRFGERCAAITNTVAAAATNATDAIKCIDKALKLCETQIASLEKRNMKHLPMYSQVKEKYSTLKLKRGEIE